MPGAVNIYEAWPKGLTVSKMIPTRYALFIVMYSLLAPGSTHADSMVNIRIGGTGSAMGAFKHLAEAFQKIRPDIEITLIPNLGSSGAIKALQADALELALSARGLKSGEHALHAEELGRTPLVIATGMYNPISVLSLEKLARVLEGKLTTWPDGRPLRLILRPESDSETVYLRAISPRMERAVAAAHARRGLHVALTDQDAANALEKIPGAIGLSTLALIVSEQRKLKPLALDGKQPSLATLARGEYPYFKPVFAITPARPSAAATAFIAFVKSRQGKQVLAANGYLPNPAASP